MHTDRDYVLALQLQEQYDRANNVAVNKYETPRKKNTDLESKLNLGSPSLEYKDPTPNVHDLFLNFNRSYFWGKLNSVAVRWSKRMYSCAGICSYSPRNGFCDIALSEPLLKLRPRKDLVETLLHEMIHAFLFVTNNDRDRDGHGPNFLSHMHRINKAANLNISVYHTFHDEVRLYQTHWWRCNGPCQKQRPYFGFVKRSSNRAPGPNDFWWKTHQLNCGGTFIKVKEPEKKQKSKEKNNNVTKSKSATPKLKSVKDLLNNSETKNKENKLLNNNSSLSISNSSSTVLLPPKTDKGRKSTSSVNNINTISSIKNRNSTGSILPFVSPVNKAYPKLSSGGKLLSSGGTSSSAMEVVPSKSVAETVGSAWLEKFSDSPAKRPNTSNSDQRPNKLPKLEPYESPGKTKFNSVQSGSSNVIQIKKEDNNCVESMIKSEIKNELDKKYSPSTSKMDTEELSLYYSIPPRLIDDCNQIMKPLYGGNFSLNETHFKQSTTLSDLWQKASEIEENCKTQCPVCYQMFPRQKIEEHVNLCIESGPSSRVDIVETKSRPFVIIKPEYRPNDTVDLTLEPSDFIKSEETEFNPNADSQDSEFGDSDYSNCPLCNKRLNRNDADEHLEQCVSMTFVNESVHETPSSEEIEETADETAGDEERTPGDKRVSCPCCYKLFEEADINGHLDDCIL